MPRAKLLAGCLLLGLSACKHPSATQSSSENLYGTDDPSGILPMNANVEVDPDRPDLPVRQAWTQGGKSLTVHRSASCPSENAEESIAESGCGNETSYHYIRGSRLLTLSTCRCGNEQSEEKKLTLAPAQIHELDKLMGSLEMVSGPQVTCTADDSATIWELIVANAEGVEQSYPVALCGNTARQTGKINVRSFQALYEYLKKTLP